MKKRAKKTSLFLPSLFFISCAVVYVVVARHLLKSTGRKDEGEGSNDGRRQKQQALLHASTHSESAGKQIQGLGPGGRVSDQTSEKVLTKMEEGGVGGRDLSVASSRESQHGVPSDDWPLFKVGVPGKGGERSVKWPGAGWRGEKKDDPGSILEKFEEKFRFYLLEEGPFEMEGIERCFEARRHASSREGHEGIDAMIKIGERKHLNALYLLPALRKHPLRTLERHEADLFVIAYDSGMARLSMPCEAVDQVGGLEEWERRMGEALLSDESFNRKGGRDFLWLHSKGNMEIASGGSEVSLEEADEARRMDENEESGEGGGGVEKGAGSVLGQILDSGPMIATSERYSPELQIGLPETWKRGSVIITPYVSSEAMDRAVTDEVLGSKRVTRVYFRGNMQGWHGHRSVLPRLAAELHGKADIQQRDFSRPQPPESALELSKSASEMRMSDLCLSPEGDAPSSARLFEALAAGCVPVVLADRHRIAFDLPFPSLIDYDSIAVFSEPLSRLGGHSRVLEASLAAALDAINADRLDEMRAKGRRIFGRWFSYMQRGEGVATGILVEAWVMMMQHGIIPKVEGVI